MDGSVYNRTNLEKVTPVPEVSTPILDGSVYNRSNLAKVSPITVFGNCPMFSSLEITSTAPRDSSSSSPVNATRTILKNFT
jgi:hypothetical protein